MREEVASAELPALGDWPGLDERERARRARILRQIERRIEEDGPRRALASPERGRQFIPFAALKGYDALLAEAEAEAAKEG